MADKTSIRSRAISDASFSSMLYLYTNSFCSLLNNSLSLKVWELKRDEECSIDVLLDEFSAFYLKK